MKNSPKTIQIFLPSGDPRGIRVAEITTRIVRVIEMPRSLVSDFLKMPEAGQVGLYFLCGESDDGDVLKLYVGQSGSVGTRIAQHNQTKDFWNKALVVVSLTNNLTQTHALFLEWLSIKEAQVAGRYDLENGNAGARPHTPPPLEADCHEIYDTARILLATLGYPIFESISQATGIQAESEVFYCKGPDASGSGLYTEEGFVVLKGSAGRQATTPSMQGGELRIRDQLLLAGVIRNEGNSIIFLKDYLFKSPSSAAAAILGRPANGWLDWKNKEGETLDAIKRQ
jgi:hypothetical protein